MKPKKRKKQAAQNVPKEGGVLDNLSPAEEAFVFALIKTGSVPEASAAAGVDRRTGRRWLNSDVVADAYRSARRDIFRQAIAKAQAAIGQVIDSLVSVAVAGQTDGARTQAGAELLRFARQAIDLDDLHLRVDGIERAEASLTQPLRIAGGAQDGPRRASGG